MTPSGLLISIDFQLFMKFVDHFVDLEPKNWAILTGFYMGEFDFTKVGHLKAKTVRIISIGKFLVFISSLLFSSDLQIDGLELAARY